MLFLADVLDIAKMATVASATEVAALYACLGNSREFSSEIDNF